MTICTLTTPPVTFKSKVKLHVVIDEFIQAESVLDYNYGARTLLSQCRVSPKNSLANGNVRSKNIHETSRP